MLPTAALRSLVIPTVVFIGLSLGLLSPLALAA
jgi:hypothetical protein